MLRYQCSLVPVRTVVARLALLWRRSRKRSRLNMFPFSSSIGSSQPYREKVADFTCDIYEDSGEGFALFATDGVDLAEAVASKGAGITICTLQGSVQGEIVARSFKEAAVTEMASELFFSSMCTGVCDAVVDEFAQGQLQFSAATDCAGKTLDSVKVAKLSSGGGIGAVTLRPKACNYQTITNYA